MGRKGHKLYVNADNEKAWGVIETQAEKEDRPISWVIWKLMRGKMKLKGVNC